MNGDIAGQIAVAALALLSIYLQYGRSDRGLRSTLKKDAELLKLLPEQSSSWRDLEAHIARRVAELVRDEAVKRRDPSGMTIALILLLIGVYLTYLTLQGGWWWYLSPVTAFFLIMGLGGFFVSVGKTERDAKGNAIKKPKAAD